MYFENNIFHNNLNENIYGQVYSSKYFWLLPIRKAHRSLISKNFTKLSYFLFKSQCCSLQPRTLLKSVTKIFMRLFWNSCTKHFGKYQKKKCMWRSSLLMKLQDYSPNPTIRLNIPVQVLFWKHSVKRAYSKFQ